MAAVSYCGCVGILGRRWRLIDKGVTEGVVTAASGVERPLHCRVLGDAAEGGESESKGNEFSRSRSLPGG